MSDKETIVALKEALLCNSLQIEQLSEEVRALMYAVQDLVATRVRSHPPLTKEILLVLKRLRFR